MLVTGAASGIGGRDRGPARAEGATVACVDVDTDGFATTVATIAAGGGGSASGGSAVAHPLDLLRARRGPGRWWRVAGETCEIPGVGPVNVDWVREQLGEAFVTAIVKNGKDITTVAHFGRHIPAELRTAMIVSGRECCIEGCSGREYLELDHCEIDHAQNGPTAWNLAGSAPSTTPEKPRAGSSARPTPSPENEPSTHQTRPAPS